jgi:F-type H+-transporting ATPase subunit delta
MTDDRIHRYATALHEIARAEGQLDRVGDELFRTARAVESSPELREALTDARLPMQRKLGLLSDLLGGSASEVTVNLVSFVVAMDRARDLPAIADDLAEQIAAARDAAVAEVRAAVPLDEATLQRLQVALSRATGKRVEVKLVVDPNVVGGVVAHVGDQVIDGSVRGRLDSIRQSMQAGAKG